MPKRNGHGIELLADATRRAIVALLALGVGGPSKIANELGLSRPATTRQLRLLHKAGLISVRRHYVDGRMVIYFIEPRRLGQITAWLAGTEVGRVFPPTPRDNAPDPSDRSARGEPSQRGIEGAERGALHNDRATRE